MFLVRYAALAALVVWIGGAAFLLIHPSSRVTALQFHQTGATCGAVIIVSLFSMKFIGPPPHAFAIRALLAAGMTIADLSARWLDGPPHSLLTLNLVLGLILLTWYARE